jgi:chitodextrinase
MVLLLLAAILVPTTLAASQGDWSRSTRNAFNDHRAPRPVHALRVADADSASVALDWSRTSDNVGVTGYGVYLDGDRSAETSRTEYTLRDLACGRGYNVGVDAFDDAGNRSRKASTFVSTSACGDLTPPSVPTDVHSVAATETSVILAWAPSTDDFGVVGYGLFVGGFWVGRWTEPSATVTNLSCGQTYQIAISAVDAAGNQSAGTDAFFSTAPCNDRTAPAPPAGLSVTKTTQNAVSVTWTPATDRSGIAEYGLYRDGAKVDTSTSTSAEFGGLECGTTYSLGVDAADNAANRSAVVTLSSATAPCTSVPPPPPSSGTPAPTAPPNLHTDSVDQSTVVLRWDSSSDPDGMAGYQIFRDGRKIGEGPGVHGGLTNQWTDRNRTCNTNYRYEVAGVDSKGTLGTKSALDVTTAACDTTTAPPPPPTTTPPPSPSQPTTPDTSAPTTPSGATASARTATSVALTWQTSKDDTGVTGYGIYNGGSRVATATTTSWIVTGLSCEHSYTFAVDAVDAAGNRSSQARVMVSTTPCADTQAPATPAALTATNVTKDSLTFTWSAPRDDVGVTGYDVYRNGAKIGSTTQPSYPISGLACESAYTLSVAAYDAAGNHSPQAQLVTRTAACPTSTSTGTNVVELSGTVTPSQFNAALAGKSSGAVTVRPAAGSSSFSVSGSLTITRPSLSIEHANLSGMITFDPGASGSGITSSSAMGFAIKGADDVRIEDNVFDGRGAKKDGGVIWDEPAGNPPSGWVVRNNDMRNFYTSDPSDHSQALYVGYSTDGLIEGNTFTKNGNTGHIFFTWFGNEANPSTSYPRNICVRGNTFNETAGAYVDINFRAEIPVSSGIKIAPGQNASSDGAAFNGPC